MATKNKIAVITASAPVVPNPKPNLLKTLTVLQFLRTAKGKTDAEIHKQLDEALAECAKVDMISMLEKVMMYMGDISRQHNLLKEMGIVSTSGGAQERAIFRSIMRWWENRLSASFKKNIPLFAEYTLYENLMYSQITTDRLKGTVVKEEVLLPMPKEVHSYLRDQIQKGRDLNLIAKHLPSYSTTKSRTTKKVAKPRKGLSSYEWTLPKGKAWVKVNGELVTGTKVTLKAGDVVSYPRTKQAKTLSKQEVLNNWVNDFCGTMNWDLKQYKAFKKMQNTPEQLFSSKKIVDVPKSDFTKLLDQLTAGQRFRVAKMVAYKDDKGNLQPKTKWGNLGNWYIEWEKGQEKVATQLREAFASGDVTKQKALQKDLKVKATGKQTVELLAECFKGGLSASQIDTTYQAMIEKMDLIANVFPVIDGSGSMDSHCATINGISLTRRQIAYAMAITFATRNPEVSLRNTFAWFSTEVRICGDSKFVNEAPNRFVAASAFKTTVSKADGISETKTFTENLKAIAKMDPQLVQSTNMMAIIEYFVAFVKAGKCDVESLPNALLWITDNEGNQGKSPKEALALANSIGWNPLMVFWGIVNVPHGMEQAIKGLPNCLLIGGFSEGALSQVLRGIKSGSIDPQDELWAIYEDKRYWPIGN